MSRPLDCRLARRAGLIPAMMNATGPLPRRPDKAESTNRSATLTNDGPWRRLRTEVRHLIEANHCAVEGAVTAQLNHLFSQYCSAPGIVAHDSTKPHLHFAPVDACAQPRSLNTIAALANLSIHGELWRLRACRAVDARPRQRSERASDTATTDSMTTQATSNGLRESPAKRAAEWKPHEFDQRPPRASTQTGPWRRSRSSPPCLQKGCPAFPTRCDARQHRATERESVSKRFQP